MSLRDTLARLGKERAIDRVWAERKHEGYYHRYTRSPEVGQRYGELCLETAARLAEGAAGPVRDPADAEAAASLLEAIVTGRVGPREVRETTGFGMEAPLFLHRLTGGARSAYEDLVASLPELNDYRPTYMTMGPTGKCNVVCPDCIIGGAIFVKERQHLHKADDVLPILAEARGVGLGKLSFCIGEPTYNLPVLYKTFDAVRESEGLEVRSMVTNALFARSYEKAVLVLRSIVEHLGQDKARKLLLGVSLNDALVGVGVPVTATANLLQAFGEVFGAHRLVLQLIQDEGFHRLQNELFDELGRRGLLDAGAHRLDAEGFHPELRLTNGVRIVVSVMRKQPSLHNPWARPDRDPWVSYFDDEALTAVPLKGLYTYEDGDDPDDEDGGLVVHRITLGPDGVLYPDYHFMVAGARPLGTSLAQAAASFRRDPILGMLLRRGGLNVLLATYMDIPAEERLIADVYAPARSCSTTGMVAANVLFGDDEVALQLATQVLTRGASVPAGAEAAS